MQGFLPYNDFTRYGIVVASFIENDSDIEIDNVIKRADEALFISKSEGRNRVCVTV